MENEKILTLESIIGRPCYSGYRGNNREVKFRLLDGRTYEELIGDGHYGTGRNTLIGLKMLTIKADELYSLPCKSVNVKIETSYDRDCPEGVGAIHYEVIFFTAELDFANEDTLYEYLRERLIKRIKDKLYEGAVLDSYDLNLREGLGLDPCKGGGNGCDGGDCGSERLTVGTILKRYCVLPGQDSIVVGAGGCNYIFDKNGYSGVLTEFGDVIKRFSLDDIRDLEVVDGVYEVNIAGGRGGKTIRLGTNVKSVNELLEAISRGRKRDDAGGLLNDDFVGSLYDEALKGIRDYCNRKG